ncbi:MAG: aminotransferase class V-fold PLP-dependent enzyme, partial [Candidatus Saccharimonas sp.]
MNEEIIYLDHAATTPVSEKVLAAMLPYFSEKFYNPSAPYVQALEVRRDYEDAKHLIAQNIGAKSDEIVITAGATESINLAFSAA